MTSTGKDRATLFDILNDRAGHVEGLSEIVEELITATDELVASCEEKGLKEVGRFAEATCALGIGLFLIAACDEVTRRSTNVQHSN